MIYKEAYDKLKFNQCIVNHKFLIEVYDHTFSFKVLRKKYIYDIDPIDEEFCKTLTTYQKMHYIMTRPEFHIVKYFKKFDLQELMRDISFSSEWELKTREEDCRKTYYNSLCVSNPEKDGPLEFREKLETKFGADLIAFESK